MATIAVEAGETSGVSITAQFAIDQGCEVFAATGNILAQLSKGTKRLIPRGTQPQLSTRDLLDILNCRVSLNRDLYGKQYLAARLNPN
jgi:predicted Rossmann fold nucleotide-binding protein DprA/Smf involved in DNA uptake